MKRAIDHDERIAGMTFSSVYPHYLAKVEKKGRTKEELHQVIAWLTGYDERSLQTHIQDKVTFEQFFQHATLNPNAHLITGTICGYRVEEIENPLTRQVRYLDKLVDELAKGRQVENILRRVLGVLVAVACAGWSLSAQSASTHTFVPEHFYNTFSGAHPVALRLKPGDRVVTKTLDAGGTDWNGKQVASGPNPQTGPFFIEGAEPGDMLVVTIEKIETNRGDAYSGSVLAPYAVDPASLLARVDREPRRVTWLLDKAKGVARLDGPELGGLELPLRPMLGCVGVAPARKEAVVTSTPGAFGGNMDYAGLTAGVTVMLPVNEPGALLFIGDGHARQGEGELVGTGLETSMDVEFRVDVVKKATIAWPRIENDTHIMVLGSERPLLQALQHATSELHRWLMSSYGLSERGAALLMGQAAEYEIANVVDPHFTVVAKMRKTYLTAFRKTPGE